MYTAKLIPGATPIPPDLIEYLLDLISPPGERAWFLGDVSFIDVDTIEGWPNNTVPGILARGEPSDEQSKEFLRALRPGAHFLLIAPDEDPIGSTGACTIEDNGFEIRDAILWVREPGDFLYTAKASRAEREAGCVHLPATTATLTEEEKAEWVKLSAREAENELTAEEEERHQQLSIKVDASKEGGIHNPHPTVKPIEIMEWALRDIPPSPMPIVDPFNGSGSTGLAAIRTRHNYLGVDLEGDYISISAARADYEIARLEHEGKIAKGSTRVQTIPKELHIKRPKRKGVRSRVRRKASTLTVRTVEDAASLHGNSAAEPLGNSDREGYADG